MRETRIRSCHPTEAIVRALAREYGRVDPLALDQFADEAVSEVITELIFQTCPHGVATDSRSRLERRTVLDQFAGRSCGGLCELPCGVHGEGIGERSISADPWPEGHRPIWT